MENSSTIWNHDYENVDENYVDRDDNVVEFKTKDNVVHITEWLWFKNNNFEMNNDIVLCSFLLFLI